MIRFINIVFFTIFVNLIYSQSIEPLQLQPSPYRNGILRAVQKVYDEWTQDTVYYYQHDSMLDYVDSVYITNDSILCFDIGQRTYCDTIRSGIDNDTQDLSIDSLNRVITISLVNGGSVKFKDTNTDQQTLSIDSTSTSVGITINNGNRIHFDVGDTNTDNQKIDTFRIVNTNKLQISLQNDGELYKEVDLPLPDSSKWAKNGLDMYNKFQTDSIGINTTNPSKALDVNGEVRIRDLSTGPARTLIAEIGDGTLQKVNVGHGLQLNSSNNTLNNWVRDSTSINNGWGINITENPINTYTVGVDSSIISTPYDLSLLQIDSFYLKSTGQLRLKQKGEPTKSVNSLIYGGASLGSNYLPIFSGYQSITGSSGTGFVKVTGGNVSYDNSSYITSEVDGSTTNEIQTITLDSTATSYGMTTSINNSRVHWTKPTSNSVTSVTATHPLISSGGTTPNISIPVASASSAGYTSIADWNTFNSKINGLGVANYIGIWETGTYIGNNSNFTIDNTNVRLLAGNAAIGLMGKGFYWAGFAHSSIASTSGAYALLQSSDGYNTWINKRSGSGSMSFRVSNVEKMSLNDNGEFAINSLASGQTAPTTSGVTKMVITDNTGKLSFKADPTYFGVNNYVAKFNSDNNLVHSIIYNADNYVGIGMTNPTYQLQTANPSVFYNLYAGDSGFGTSWAGVGHYSAIAAGNTNYALLQNSTGTITNLNRKSGGGMFFRKDDVTQMEINDNGELTINSLASGQTAPTTLGVTKMVITDITGKLSFKADPTFFGVNNYVAKFNSDNNLVHSIIYNADNYVGIGMTNPTYQLQTANPSVFYNLYAGDSGFGTSWAGVGHYSAIAAGNTNYALLQNSTGTITNLNRKSGGGMFFRKDDVTQMEINDNGELTVTNLGSGIVKATSGKLGLATAGTDYTTSVTGTLPISSSGGATPNITITNAAADGATKGAASFSAYDFNSSFGNITIDYTNGTAASASAKGFLSSTDWTTFNNKLSTEVDGSTSNELQTLTIDSTSTSYGLTTSINNQRIHFSKSSGSSQWTLNGTTLYPTSASNHVLVGSTSTAYDITNFNVNGNMYLSGGMYAHTATNTYGTGSENQLLCSSSGNLWYKTLGLSLSGSTLSSTIGGVSTGSVDLITVHPIAKYKTGTGTSDTTQIASYARNIKFTQEIYDPSNSYSISGNQITVPSVGYYEITATLSINVFTPPTTSDLIAFFVKVNNTEVTNDTKCIYQTQKGAPFAQDGTTFTNIIYVSNASYPVALVVKNLNNNSKYCYINDLYGNYQSSITIKKL